MKVRTAKTSHRISVEIPLSIVLCWSLPLLLRTTTAALPIVSAAMMPVAPSWKVRPSTLDDKVAVQELLQASYSSLLAPDYDPDLLQVALPKICQPRDELLTCGTWYVVEDTSMQADGTTPLIGCGGWTPRSPFQEDIPHLRHFATHPQHTRKGVARAIWNQTWKDWCDYHYFKESETNHDNATKRKEVDDSSSLSVSQRPDMEVLSTLSAESFYASLGFAKVRDIDVPFGPNCLFPSILMRRPDNYDGRL